MCADPSARLRRFSFELCLDFGLLAEDRPKCDQILRSERAVREHDATGVADGIAQRHRPEMLDRQHKRRAAEALAATTPLFLLLFASAYFVLSRDDPMTFTQQLSRSDALYFTITIFSTVGFGDITPQGEATRLVVAVQMLLDLLVLGLGIQVIVGAARQGRAAQLAGEGGTRDGAEATSR